MIPFSPPRLDEKSVEEVGKVLLSGWITTGPKTKEFEKQLTEYTGCRKTLCLGSATAGMELVLRWFGVGPGDEVILPAYTYCATANVVIHCGAKPVLVDINTEDFNISLESIRKAVTEKTKAIMPVDIGGWPCDYDAILSLTKEEGVHQKFSPSNERQEKLGRMLVLSDAAHSIGASYKGRRQGSVADITVFSFHAVKNLTTAEGGAVCMNLPDQFDCDEVYSKLNIKSLHGQTKDALAKTKIGSWRYDVVEPGYKCNMMDIQAAIGLVELSRYDQTLERRKEIVKLYTEGFQSEDWATIPKYEEGDSFSSYHLFLLRINGAEEEDRDKIIEKIFEREVAVNVHFLPIPMLTAYKNMGYRIEDYPNTYNAFKEEITLPVYYDLTDENVQTVISAVKDAVKAILG